MGLGFDFKRAYLLFGCLEEYVVDILGVGSRFRVWGFWRREWL